MKLFRLILIKFGRGEIEILTGSLSISKTPIVRTSFNMTLMVVDLRVSFSTGGEFAYRDSYSYANC